MFSESGAATTTADAFFDVSAAMWCYDEKLVVAYEVESAVNTKVVRGIDLALGSGGNAMRRNGSQVE
jgi:hypothetical protein